MRRLLAAFASLLLVGLLAGSASAGASDDRSKGHDKTTRVTLYSTETAFTVVSAEGVVNPPENDPASFTPGARLMIVDTLYSDEARTDEVGRNDILCTFTEVQGPAAEPTGATVLCSGVAQLDDRGSLAWMGSVTFDFSEEETGDEPFATLAITGGTESFRAAGGQVTLFDVSPDDGTETLNRYELELLKFKSRR